MKIKIAGKNFDVFDYDDETTILSRYFLDFPETLPSYFRVSKKGIAKNTEIEDVRDIIRDMSQEDLNDAEIIQKILTDFPYLRKKDIGFIWIRENPKDKIIHENFKKLDRSLFLNDKNIKSGLKIYEDEIESIREKSKHILSKETAISKQLSEIEPVETKPFVIEEITNELALYLPGKESLLDIFDSMDVSKNIPFIVLVYKNKRYYKIWSLLVPPDSWIDEVLPEGIHFKIYNNPPTISKKILFENLYADGAWDSENNVYTTFKIRDESDKGNEKMIREKIFDSIGNRLEYNIVSSRQLSIKGVFEVSLDFQKYVFSDLIFNNALFKRFLFLDERDKTVMEKKRFYMHYTAFESANASDSLGLTFTQEENDILKIRIAYAANISQAESAKKVISKLLQLYLQEKSGIEKLYSSIYSGVATSKKKVISKKEDKKTGRRAALLAKISPMFQQRYPDQCQKERQPEIVEDADVKKVVAKFGNPHKLMNFEDRWYVCDPREPDEKNHDHLWPGLKKNTSKFDEKYKEDYPLLPCCFKADQYTKGAAELRKYMTKDKDMGEKKKTVGAEYVVGTGKPSAPGRYGEMPFNWEKIFRYLKLEKVKRGKQEVYPILRYGVVYSPYSFITCLEKAVNRKFDSSSEIKVAERIKEIREDLLNQNLQISKQEMYDYSKSDIKAILKDDAQYIDPDLFISLLQQYYEINIFLYVIDSDHPNGDIVIPRHSKAYLSRQYNEARDTVLVIKYEVKGSSYPYQCELVVHNKFDGSQMQAKFQNSELTKIAAKMFYDSNEVFIVNTDGYDPYQPVPE